MALLRTCDRCNQTISEGFSRVLFRKALLLRTAVPRRSVDLCKDCVAELNTWLDRGKADRSKTWIASQQSESEGAMPMA
jgi:hypothetical protein